MPTLRNRWTSRRSAWWLAAPGHLALLVLFAAQPAMAQRPNIVLIIADDMGWDDTGAYGHPTLRTPHLDRLARGGIRFDRAFVTTSSCSPSRSSIITGRYPHNTGAEQLHWPLPGEQLTFVELLKDDGYWTAAAGKWHLGDEIRDRFDVVKDIARFGATMPGRGDLSGAEQWVETLRERPQDRPFFLWLASLDPHREYHAGAIPRPHRPAEILVPPYLPDTPEVRTDLALYADEVSRLDRYVGDVLDELERQGVADNTLVLFLSDNGRPFPRAKTTLYDSGIHTPFLASWPGHIEPGSVSSRLVSTVDIAPTILELAGVQRPAPFQGISIAPLLRNPAQKVRDYIYAEKNWHDFEDRSRAVRSERFKYIRNDYADLPNTPPADALRSPTFEVMRRLYDAGQLPPEQRVPFVAPRPAEELYDTWADPFELRNLADDPRYESVLDELRSALDLWQRTTQDVRPAARTPDEFDRQTGEALPNRVMPRRPPP